MKFEKAKKVYLALSAKLDELNKAGASEYALNAVYKKMVKARDKANSLAPKTKVEKFFKQSEANADAHYQIQANFF